MGERPTINGTSDAVGVPGARKTLISGWQTGELLVYHEASHSVSLSMPIGGAPRQMVIHAPSKTLVVASEGGFIDFIR